MATFADNRIFQTVTTKFSHKYSYQQPLQITWKNPTRPNCRQRILGSLWKLHPTKHEGRKSCQRPQIRHLHIHSPHRQPSRTHFIREPPINRRETNLIENLSSLSLKILSAPLIKHLEYSEELVFHSHRSTTIWFSWGKRQHS